MSCVRSQAYNITYNHNSSALSNEIPQYSRFGNEIPQYSRFGNEIPHTVGLVTKSRSTVGLATISKELKFERNLKDEFYNHLTISNLDEPNMQVFSAINIYMIWLSSVDVWKALTSCKTVWVSTDLSENFVGPNS